MQQLSGMRFPEAVDAVPSATHPDGARRSDRRRLRRAMLPAIAGASMIALMLHLVSALASRLSFVDPVSDLSVIAGISAVLAILFPFTALFLRLMRVALRTKQAQAAAAGRR